jgi:hypothetical protein
MVESQAESANPVRVGSVGSGVLFSEFSEGPKQKEICVAVREISLAVGRDKANSR